MSIAESHVPGSFVVTDDEGRYLGLVFRYVGGFSHSIQNHGEALLPTVNDAAADLAATKERLPERWQRAIWPHITP